MTEKAELGNVCCRPRAAAILVAGSLVLLQQKIGDAIWALPGGKVERLESSQAALVREIQEELDWTPTGSRLVCVVENCFEHGGITHQEYGFYYAIDAETLWSRDGQLPAGREFSGADPSLVFRWESRSRLATVEFRPAVVLDIVRALPGEIRHLTSGFEPA